MGKRGGRLRVSPSSSKPPPLDPLDAARADIGEGRLSIKSGEATKTMEKRKRFDGPF